eukprot:8864845-Ditylum_brightwellii.AAC.1
MTSSWSLANNAYPVSATTTDLAEVWICKPYFTCIAHPPPVTNTFESYFATLELWDSVLLQEVHISKTIHTIAQYLQDPNETVIIASNGSLSEEDNTISYGWIMANADEEILANHVGPVYGKATSFQAERYSLLSIVHFMQPIQCMLNFYADNEGVVVRTKYQISYTHDYPFSTLDPGWDIIAQTASTLKMRGTHPKITHIKSHQDNMTMEDDLDFPVQLNLAVD